MTGSTAYFNRVNSPNFYRSKLTKLKGKLPPQLLDLPPEALLELSLLSNLKNPAPFSSRRANQALEVLRCQEAL
ncbi:MAG: hypothetical protein VKK59_01835, partial [Vampirovibrionales bacterium]|nr:hypothetical protein [Vampirovibrionales bacterium]